MLAINTPTYKLAKCLVPILKPLTINEYAVKHSMLNKILNSLMGNQDVDFLFTNIPLEKAIDIFANTFLKILEKKGLSKMEFKEFLPLVTTKSYFIFSGKLYKQAYWITMGSPLGLTLVNAFLVYFEKNWLQNCLSHFKPYYYQCYVDDIFVLFTHQNI